MESQLCAFKCNKLLNNYTEDEDVKMNCEDKMSNTTTAITTSSSTKIFLFIIFIAIISYDLLAVIIMFLPYRHICLIATEMTFLLVQRLIKLPTHMNVRFVITTTSKINFIPQPSISDVSCKILQKCIRFHQLATIPTNVNRCGTYF